MPSIRLNTIPLLYEAKDEACAQSIQALLSANLQSLFDFFEIEGFAQPKQLILYPFIADYRQYKLASSGYYEEWMIAEQKDHAIRILCYDECLKTVSHVGQAQVEFEKLILHEFVHACQQEV